jgi:hypothetical protein
MSQTPLSRFAPLYLAIHMNCWQAVLPQEEEIALTRVQGHISKKPFFLGAPSTPEVIAGWSRYTAILSRPSGRHKQSMRSLVKRVGEYGRRRWDSNPRRLFTLHDFQSCSLDHYETPPEAERVGFEPTRACTLPLFESGTFDHSDISPCRSITYPSLFGNSFFPACQLLAPDFSQKKMGQRKEKNGSRNQRAAEAV